MLALAVARHEGQFDKGGNPYILHPLKVMHYLKTDDEELQCIALGHDLIEDTFPSVEVGESVLRAHGISDRVIDGIIALTKVPGESFEAYKAKVMANPDAVKVKKADLRHNSDIRRLRGVTAKDLARVERYQNFYLELSTTEEEARACESELRSATVAP